MAKRISTILLVDDDLAINFFHKRLLNKLALGETIITAHNGASAISELISLNGSQKEDDLAIIFLDLNMPVMDGWGFLEHFENIHHALKFEYKITCFLISSKYFFELKFSILLTGKCNL
jgi:CheY-like chemotaxis protein